MTVVFNHGLKNAHSSETSSDSEVRESKMPATRVQHLPKRSSSGPTSAEAQLLGSNICRSYSVPQSATVGPRKCANPKCWYCVHARAGHEPDLTHNFIIPAGYCCSKCASWHTNNYRRGTPATHGKHCSIVECTDQFHKNDDDVAPEPEGEVERE